LNQWRISRPIALRWEQFKQIRPFESVIRQVVVLDPAFGDLLRII